MGKISHNGAAKNRIKPIALSNTSDVRKFTRRELEEACCKLPQKNYRHNEGRNKRLTKSKHEQLVKQGDADTESQVKTLDSGVKICARKYNECKAHADRLDESLIKRKDELIELEREAAVLQDMILGKNFEAKKISKLTAEIAVTNKNAEEKLTYRLKLNHICQRQRKNSIIVDAHMSSISSTLLSAGKERQRCKKMMAEIESGLTHSVIDLESLSHEIDVERADNHRTMNKKKNEAKNAETLEEWRKVQESNRASFEQTLGGTYQTERGNRLDFIHEREKELKNLVKAMEVKTSGQGSLEEAFIHIKRATGVNSLAEMVDKFTHYQEHISRLKREQREAEKRSGKANSSLETTQTRFDKLKENGFGDTELSRKIIDDIHENIVKERTKGKVMKSTNIRLECILVGLRQGGMGLYQRLLPFHPTLLDGDAPTLSESATSSATQAANDTLEMIKITQQILDKMLDVVGGVRKVRSSGETPEHYQSKVPIESLDNPNLCENNCRIQTKVCMRANMLKFCIVLNQFLSIF